MNIFVTGGTGFIGSYVVHELVQCGHKVTILARNSTKVSGFLNHSQIDILQGTLYDNSVIEKGLSGKDACVHIALGWGDTALDMLEMDTKSSLFIFETAAQLGLKKLIYTSSTAAVGELRERMNEEFCTRPVDFYGATKAASEVFLSAISHKYPMQCNIIRPGYTFGNPVVEGAFMQPDHRFKEIVGKARKNEDIHLIKNDGTQFIWAGDLAKLYAAVLHSDNNRQIYLGLGTEFVTWEEITQYAIDYTGSKSRIILEDKGWTRGSFLFDVSKMGRDFGFEFTSMEKIREHVRYIASLNEA